MRLAHPPVSTSATAKAAVTGLCEGGAAELGPSTVAGLLSEGASDINGATIQLDGRKHMH
jgi:hypothetical protein